jgi:hypothetical protein
MDRSESSRGWRDLAVARIVKTYGLGEIVQPRGFGAAHKRLFGLMRDQAQGGRGGHGDSGAPNVSFGEERMSPTGLWGAGIGVQLFCTFSRYFLN